MNLFTKQNHRKRTYVYWRGKGVRGGQIRSLGLADANYYMENR